MKGLEERKGLGEQRGPEQQKESAEPSDFSAGPVRVMLATSDPHLRMVVAQELAAHRRIDVVAQAGSAAEARWRMSHAGLDVLLIDLRLDRALELIGLCGSLHRKAEVVTICATDDEDAAVQAFHAGASGCLARNAWFGRFAQAVLDVANGCAVLPPALARRLLRQQHAAVPPSPARGPAAAPGRALSGLSHRETEVLAMVARGLRTREIGQQLTISADTVNAHIKSIYHKLQVRSRAQAVRIATQAGLL